MTTGIIAIRSASSLGRARRARWSASLTLRASIAAKIGLATTYDSCMRSEEEATQLIAKDGLRFRVSTGRCAPSREATCQTMSNGSPASRCKETPEKCGRKNRRHPRPVSSDSGYVGLGLGR